MFVHMLKCIIRERNDKVDKNTAIEFIRDNLSRICSTSCYINYFSLCMLAL